MSLLVGAIIKCKFCACSRESTKEVKLNKTHGVKGVEQWVWRKHKSQFQFLPTFRIAAVTWKSYSFEWGKKYAGKLESRAQGKKSLIQKKPRKIKGRQHNNLGRKSWKSHTSSHKTSESKWEQNNSNTETLTHLQFNWNFHKSTIAIQQQQLQQ